MPRIDPPARRPVPVALCLMLLCVAVAVVCAAAAPKAEAAYYKMVLCSANNGPGSPSIATNTISPQNPAGIFVYQNQCSGGGFPAGGDQMMRLFENQGSGSAGYQSYASVSWSAPGSVAIAAGGGYSRQPNDFADGWRARFWGEGQDGSTNNFLMQGVGVANNSLGGIGWARTTVFAPHLWPFPTYGSYRRFVFEMTCFRQAGCDRSGFNATDANSFVLILNDVDPSRINLTNTGSGVLSGSWVKGSQNVTWNVSDQGSGMRFDRLRVDGGTRQQIDWRGSCDLDANGATGEFARQFRPCPTGGPWGRTYSLDTAGLSDGSHTVQVCSQDYGQASGLNGSGGESCDQRSIRVDNHAPAAPGGLSIVTANPERYLDRFGARWALNSDPGSPVKKVHYTVVNAAGKEVMSEKTVSATNPTKLEGIAGPDAAGDYRLRVWLEDEVGLAGPPATVPIPHDTTPPAAPQALSVTSPLTPRSAEGFDLRWQNIVDAGSPIDAARYEVLDGDGAVVVPGTTVRGDNIRAIGDLNAPAAAGSYRLRLRLSDAEGNVGAPVTAPLSYECQRSLARGATQLSAFLGGEIHQTVQQGQGTVLGGSLAGASGPVATAPVCVFTRVQTDAGRDFLGIALTNPAGGYRFPVPTGPSREVIAIHRDGSRQLGASAMLHTVVHPTLRARKTTIRNGRSAFFEGEIPGPHNDEVTIVLQVRSGQGWLAFRRYRTRNDGHFEMTYPFRRTTRATSYEMRAQVREAGGYPYVEGDSDPLRLRVVPGSPKRKRGAAKSRCAKKRKVGRRGHKHCPRKKRHRHHRAGAHHR